MSEASLTGSSAPSSESTTASWPAERPLPLFVAGCALVLGITFAIGSWELARANGNIYVHFLFRHQFLRFDYTAIPTVVGLLLASLALSRIVSERPVQAVLGWISGHRVLFALLSLALIAAVTPWTYQDYPLAPNEFAPVWQSRLFAAGQLFAHYPRDYVSRLVPSPGEFFKLSTVDGTIISAPWPTQAILLTPFTMLGIPWMLDPLAAAATLLVLAHLAERLLPEQPLAPAWAMVLALASPAFVLYGVSYYSSAPQLLASVSYAALFLDPTPRRLFFAGLIGGAALALPNPFPHAAFAVPWILWLAFRRRSLTGLVALGAGYLPGFLLLGVGWAWELGRITAAVKAAQGVQTTFLERLSANFFNAAFGLPPTPEGRAYILKYLAEVRVLWFCKVFLWAVPGLLFAAMFGVRWIRQNTTGRLLAWSAVSVFVAYSCQQFDQGHGWGFRYFHPAFGALPILGAAWLTRDPAGRRWTSFFGVLTAGSLLLLVPLQLRHAHDFIAEAQTMPPAHDPQKRQWVFVDVHPIGGGATPAQGGRYWSQDAIRNGPFLDQPTLVLSSRTPEDDAAMVQSFHPGAKRIVSNTHGTVWALPPLEDDARR
jgi:hypothetical protein